MFSPAGTFNLSRGKTKSIRTELVKVFGTISADKEMCALGGACRISNDFPTVYCILYAVYC
jgi:hypothetical protein